MSDHVHRRVTDEDEAVQAPPGMTQEQLDFFTEAAHRTARKAAKEAVSHYRKRATAGFVALTIGLLGVTWLGTHDSQQARTAIVKSGRTVAVTGCNRDFNSTTALRGVLIASDQFAQQARNDGRISAADYETRREFYNAQLATLVVPDCREAERVVTDDPRNIRNIPDPLYPDKMRDDKKPNEGG